MKNPSLIIALNDLRMTVAMIAKKHPAEEVLMEKLRKTLARFESSNIPATDIAGINAQLQAKFSDVF
jgi:hypothetical protein